MRKRRHKQAKEFFPFRSLNARFNADELLGALVSAVHLPSIGEKLSGLDSPATTLLTVSVRWPALSSVNEHIASSTSFIRLGKLSCLASL